MTDVARLAGVSHQTVSRVLNDGPNVAESTRERVLAAINELGYRPNRTARALVTGRSDSLGVVALRSTLFGPASMLTAFEQAAAAAGFTVTITGVPTLDQQAISNAVERHLAQRVDGVVVIAPIASAADALDAVHGQVPLVAIDGDPDRGTPVVTIDQEMGGRLATRHLLDLGHQTVWHVSGPPDWYDAIGRVRGWRSTLLDAGAAVPPVIPADWSASSGYAAGQALARMPEVTGVFAASDHIALGILRAFHEHGIDVPGDVSVVGFDDVPEAAFFSPPLTTVRQDFEQVARLALQALLAQMNSDKESQHPTTVDPVLVTRGSVAPPRIVARPPI